MWFESTGYGHSSQADMIDSKTTEITQSVCHWSNLSHGWLAGGCAIRWDY